MKGLKDTFANLSRLRDRFERLLSSAAKRGGGEPPVSGRLREVVGFGSNPGSLRMFAYVPKGWAKPGWLVVALHGCTQTAAVYDHGSGWSTLADTHGFAVLFPEQQRANNPNNCFNWFLPADTMRGHGEVLSVRQMVERMVRDHGIDRRRIYIVGLSAGGAMAAAMLATYPEVFAGGAIIAGLPYGSARNVQEAFQAMAQGSNRSARAWGDLVRNASAHRGPWPKISVWHGSDDAIVNPSNMEDALMQWSDVHGVGVQPRIKHTIEGHSRRVWRTEADEDGRGRQHNGHGPRGSARLARGWALRKRRAVSLRCGHILEPSHPGILGPGRQVGSGRERSSNIGSDAGISTYAKLRDPGARRAGGRIDRKRAR
jgi:feruloyl esterase